MGGGCRVGRVRLRGGGQGRCERRSEVFVKIKKKIFLGGGGRVGGSDWGVRVDVNEEFKCLTRCEPRSEVFAKIQKKNIFFFFFFGGGGSGPEGRVGGGGSGWM